ncbi:hypothetical protein EJ110_NYTH39249 [Nymphaea thermarum]|nr:hypothetical protein EJ110_NYTH39249 [Nymphaea thermarum]
MNAKKMECVQPRNGTLSDIPSQNLDLHQYSGVETRQVCNVGASFPASSPDDLMRLIDPKQSSTPSHESIEFLEDHLPIRSAVSNSMLHLNSPYPLNSNQFASPQFVSESIDDFLEFSHGSPQHGYNHRSGELPRRSLQMHCSQLLQPKVSSDTGTVDDSKCNISLKPMLLLSSCCCNHHPSVGPLCEESQSNCSKWNDLHLNLRRHDCGQLETNFVKMRSQANTKQEGRGEQLERSENKSGVVRNSSSMKSSGFVSAGSKTRMSWTRELHERFVEFVNRLGGADKATPNGILKLMNSDKLTLFQVKSHLQVWIDFMLWFQQFQNNEQEKLQLQIEEHRKWLGKLFEEHQKCSRRLFGSPQKDVAGSDEQSDVIGDARESRKDGPLDLQSTETISNLNSSMHGESRSEDL